MYFRMKAFKLLGSMFCLTQSPKFLRGVYNRHLLYNPSIFIITNFTIFQLTICK